MADADIQRQINTNTTATISSAIALNNLTSVTVVNANTKRIFLFISNIGNKDVWIKLQAASVDDDKKGIFIHAHESWKMPSDNIYTGEVSGIADKGTPSIFITEY